MTTLSPAKVPPSFAMLDVRCIAPDANQVRRTFDADALAELADSIKEHGIIEPIIVRPGAEVDDLVHNITHTLIAGERRWRAAMLAGLPEVPAIIRSDLAGEDLAVVQVLENLQRSDLTLPELGAGVAKLAHALGTAKTAAQLGKSEGWVSKHARLDALPECITACIDAGTLTSADMAHDLARMIELADQLDHQTYRRNQLLEAAADGSLTRADLRQTISNFKEWIERNQRIEAERIERERQQAQQGNAEAPNDDDAPAPLSSQQQAEDAARQARLQAEATRRAECEAIAPIAEQLRNEVYAALCAALGTEPHRYSETGEPAATEAEHDEPGVHIDLPAWWSEHMPVPTADDLHTTHPIILNIPLPLAEAHRLIHWLAHKDDPIPVAANPEAADTAEADSPPSFVDWCADNLVADPSARTQCVDVHQAYNATQPEKVIKGRAARWTMQDNRWAKRADEAGLTKKRFTTGFAYVGVRMVGGGE